MVIPLILIVFATLAAAVVAYGPTPAWGALEHGLQVIVWSRRLQWPLVTLSIMLCLLLIATVVLGKRRAWWLIGLGPILALFVHHFALFSPDRAGALAVLENPPMVDAASARGIADDDWVVGVRFAGGDYAYPFALLFRAPVIVQTDRDARMVLLWSAYANRVLAFEVSNALKARNLEVVSTPANALLVFDTRHGQFINGLKGLTLQGTTPWGFGKPLQTTKTTWWRWRMAHVEGKVMAWRVPATGEPAAPTRPILPEWSMPIPPADAAAAGFGQGQPAGPGRRVTVVGIRRPVAMETSEVTAVPANVLVDGQQVLLFRPAPDAAPRAFDARLPADPRVAGSSPTTIPAADVSPSWFVPLSSGRMTAAHPDAAFVEINSNTVWTTAGTGVARTKSAGKHLTPVPVDDDVDWAVMKYWYPGLKMTVPEASAARRVEMPVVTPAPARRGKKGTWGLERQRMSKVFIPKNLGKVHDGEIEVSM